MVIINMAILLHMQFHNPSELHLELRSKSIHYRKLARIEWKIAVCMCVYLCACVCMCVFVYVSMCMCVYECHGA